MEARAQPMLAELGSVSPSDQVPGIGVAERMRTLLETRFPKHDAILIVDREWHVLAAFGAAEQDGTSPLSVGQGVSWKPLPDRSYESTGQKRGQFEASDGMHLAVACPLAPGPGFVLFHLPVAGITVNPAILSESLLPISGIMLFWLCTLLAIIGYMTLTRFYDRLEHRQAQSATDASRQAQNLVRTRDAVIFGLAKLAESRDPATGDHLERISAYSTMLASALRRTPKFRDAITPAFIKTIGISSALHDIGKVGVEDSILLKNGPLTADEYRRMQRHTTIGGECLDQIERRLGRSNFLQMARRITSSHHERWDGTGYPNGLAGEDIPLSARIVAVADVYDALSSKRVYKEALPHTECVAIIRNESGRQFDPDIIEVWLDIEAQFLSIARKFGNAAPDGSDGEFQQADSPLRADVTPEDERQAVSLASTESMTR